MEWLVGMTLPGLVLLLTVLGAFEVVSARRARRRAAQAGAGSSAGAGAGDGWRSRHRGTAMAATGFDLLQEALYPSKRYEIEERDAQALMAEEDDDGAPPRSSIDLGAGTAVIRLPKPANPPGGRSAEGPRR